MSTSRIVIGRQEQIEVLRGHLLGLQQGRVQQNVLFITGEAGIGKSTLLAAATEMFATLPRPPRTALVECSTPLAGQDIGEVEALQPWIAIIQQLAVDPGEGRNDTSKMIGEIAMAWVRCIPVVGDVIESVADTATIFKRRMGKEGERKTAPVYAADQQQMFQQYINLLAKLSERSPLVLMLDDFHWADTSSTNLLFTAARQLQRQPVLFIIAYRADDAHSSRGGEGHPLLHVRNELERYSLAAELSVPQMTSDDLDTLLRARYSNYQNDDLFEEWLAKVSGGNALFITQFLDTLEEDGYIDRSVGAIGDGYQGVQAPASAYAVVSERLRRLTDEASELLRYASVEGDIFTIQVLAAITEIPQLKLLQRLRLTEQSHHLIRSLGKQLVYTSETTAYQFVHALLQRVMYEGLEAEERELLHEAVLGVLKGEWERATEKGENIPGIAARLAVHADVLGEYLLAAEALLAGARASWEQYAEQETLRQITGALGALEQAEAKQKAKSTDIDAIEAKILLTRGRVHMHRGRHEEAGEDFLRAIPLFEKLGDRTSLVDAMNYRGSLLRLLHDFDEAESYTRGALAIADEIGYRKGAAGSLRVLGIIYYSRHEYEPALDLYGRSLAIDREIGDRYGEAGTLTNIGAAQFRRSCFDDALSNYQESLAICGEIGFRVHEANLLNNIGTIHDQRGEKSEAQDYYERALAIHRAAGARAGEATLLTNLGNIWMERGQAERAVEHYTESLDVARKSGLGYAETLAMIGLGEAWLRLNRADVASPLLEGAIELAAELHLSTQEQKARELLLKSTVTDPAADGAQE